MKHAIKERWIVALNSDEYKQTQGTLCKYVGTTKCHCALGVLGDLYTKETGEDFVAISQYGQLANEIREWSGLSINEHRDILELNDHYEATFADIAKELQSWS